VIQLDFLFDKNRLIFSGIFGFFQTPLSKSIHFL